MDNNIKIEKNYDSAKMQKAIMLMEQFWLLSTSKNVTEDERKCAKGLYEHYKRLAICILTKEMPEKLVTNLVIDVDFMKNLYKKYES